MAVMDSATRSRLDKMIALMDSPSPGEAATARHKATELLQRHGMT